MVYVYHAKSVSFKNVACCTEFYISLFSYSFSLSCRVEAVH